MNRGFTLIEFMVVISLISLITMLGVAGLKRFDSHADLEIINKRVQVAQSALDSYIRTQCHSASFTQPTAADLIARGLIVNPDDITSPVTGNVFLLSVNWTFPYEQTVLVDIGSNSKALGLFQSTDGSSVIGNSLEFTRPYIRFTENDNEEGKLFRNMFEPAGGCL